MRYACKAGYGSPRCRYKRNAKGTPLHSQHGYIVGCGYEGECSFKLDVVGGGEAAL